MVPVPLIQFMCTLFCFLCSLKVCAWWRGGADRPESRTWALPIVVIRVQGSKEKATCIDNWWNSENCTRYWNSCSYNVHNCCGVAIQRYHRVRSFPCNDVVDQFMLLGLLCPMYYWLCALSTGYILWMIRWLLWSMDTRDLIKYWQNVIKLCKLGHIMLKILIV